MFVPSRCVGFGFAYTSVVFPLPMAMHTGGADSALFATIVGAVCRLVTEAAQKDEKVAVDLRRVCHKDEQDNGKPWVFSSPQKVVDRVLITHGPYLDRGFVASNRITGRSPRGTGWSVPLF